MIKYIMEKNRSSSVYDAKKLKNTGGHKITTLYDVILFMTSQIQSIPYCDVICDFFLISWITLY